MDWTPVNDNEPLRRAPTTFRDALLAQLGLCALVPLVLLPAVRWGYL